MTETLKTVAIVGTVGLPPRYGGFETLADNLVRQAEDVAAPVAFEVYCSTAAYPERAAFHHGARLRYVPLRANGLQSIAYDIWSLLAARLRGMDAVLLLGVSGAIALPFLRLGGGPRVIVNVDGLEWKRQKWNGLARWFLRLSERLAVRHSDVVVGDNQAIVDHLRDAYGCRAELIPYGGDHAGSPAAQPPADEAEGTSGAIAPADYALMLCRIEPENNIDLILEAFAQNAAMRLVAVGNWEASDYGRALRRRHAGSANLDLRDPVFEPEQLYRLRSGARAYVHGHSAGGTNPALVEMMWLGIPVLAFDCVYNRHTTEGAAAYFTDAADLRAKVATLGEPCWPANGAAMHAVAARRYRWAEIARQYLALMR